MSIEINGVENIATLHQLAYGPLPLPQLFIDSPQNMVDMVKEVSAGKRPILAIDGWTTTIGQSLGPHLGPSYVVRDATAQLPDGTVIIMGDSGLAATHGIENQLFSNPSTWLGKSIMFLSVFYALQKSGNRLSELFLDFLKIQHTDGKISRRDFFKAMLMGTGYLATLYTIPGMGNKFVDYLLDTYQINLIDFYVGLPPEIVDLRTLVLNQKVTVMKSLLDIAMPHVLTVPMVVLGQGHYGYTSIEKVRRLMIEGNSAIVAEVEYYLDSLRLRNIPEEIILGIRDELLKFTVAVKVTHLDNEAFLASITDMVPEIDYNQSL